MNNIASIQRHLDAEFPRHHVVLTQNGWPHALVFDLVGPRVEWDSVRSERLRKYTGCQETYLLGSTLAADEHTFTRLEVYAT